MIVGINPAYGYSVLFDLRVMEKAFEYSEEAETLSEKLKQKRVSWNPVVRQELMRQGVLG